MQLVYKILPRKAIARDLVQRFNSLRPCLLCQAACCGSDSPFSQLCAACRMELPYILNPCFHCGIELPEGSDHGAICAQCQQHAPVFTRCLAPFHFKTPVNGLIHGFKDQANFAFGRSLAALLCHYIEEQLHALPRPDALLPLPLHRRKLRQRGFNQSSLLAHGLAKPLQIPLLRHTLLQQTASREQKTLNRQQRRRNMQDVFTLRAGQSLQGRHIALVDDVVTSQATVNAASKVLIREGGAARVDIYCLARVDMP